MHKLHRRYNQFFSIDGLDATSRFRKLRFLDLYSLAEGGAGWKIVAPNLWNWIQLDES
jgi:hypothetical protein